MIRFDFPKCCTAHIIGCFGESNTAASDYGAWNRVDPSSETVIEKFIRNEVKKVKAQGHCLIAITTNNKQTKINNVLTKLKVDHSAWMCKSQHRQTKVRIWYIDVNKFEKKLNKK